MKYEIVFIVRPNLDEKALADVVQNFSKILTNNKAQILETKELGQKELAYDIKGHRTGYYYVINIESKDAKAAQEFDRLALISEDVIRHLIVNLDK